MEGRGWLGIFLSHPIYWGRASQLNPEHTDSASQASLLALRTLFPLSWCWGTDRQLHGCSGSKLGSLHCVASVFPSELLVINQFCSWYLGRSYFFSISGVVLFGRVILVDFFFQDLECVIPPLHRLQDSTWGVSCYFNESKVEVTGWFCPLKTIKLLLRLLTVWL